MAEPDPPPGGTRRYTRTGATKGPVPAKPPASPRTKPTAASIRAAQQRSAPAKPPTPARTKPTAASIRAAQQQRSATGQPGQQQRSATRQPAQARRTKPTAASIRAAAAGQQPPGPDFSAMLDELPPLAEVEAPAQTGGRLRNEIVGPLGLGVLVLVAALGLIAAATASRGAIMVVLLVSSGVALTGVLVWWICRIVETTATEPLAAVRAALQQVEEGKYDTRLALDGAREVSELAVGFNRMAMIVGHQRDRLKHLADTDSLTGLANHRYLHDWLRGAIQRARDSRTPLAVVTLDIDGFKQLNAVRGHARGDEALRAAAAALRKAMRPDDMVARLGGDDFVLVLAGADPALARDIAERAREAMMRCLPDDPPLTCSAGYVCFPEQHTADGNLAELAHAALEVAKRAGGDQTAKYDPELVAAIPTVRQQRAEIDELLASGNPITPVFQPLVELATGRLIGYEALSRFNSPLERGPEGWFNQALQCGRSLELEAAAIRAALGAPQRPQSTYLSLNFSPSAICSGQMLKLLPERLNDVVIEITEHELAGEDEALDAGLRRLRERGARIAVDDAGAGYAGLSQVMRVQPDLIKLDRSLVEGVDRDSAKSALIEFFVMFARRVGASVCSEGIETLDELRALINLGVTYGQGYLLGRPTDPWSEIAPELTRALSTGALNAHAHGGPAAGRRQPATAAVPVGADREARQARTSVPTGAPINRRLSRYRSR